MHFFLADSSGFLEHLFFLRRIFEFGMYFITTEARLAKDWGQADNIRSQLSDEGVPWQDEAQWCRRAPEIFRSKV